MAAFVSMEAEEQQVVAVDIGKSRWGSKEEKYNSNNNNNSSYDDDDGGVYNQGGNNFRTVSLNPRRGERGMVIKTHEGDWALVTAEWAGLCNGIPAGEATFYPHNSCLVWMRTERQLFEWMEPWKGRGGTCG